LSQGASAGDISDKPRVLFSGTSVLDKGLLDFGKVVSNEPDSIFWLFRVLFVKIANL
jgi:hypothetical protein